MWRPAILYLLCALTLAFAGGGTGCDGADQNHNNSTDSTYSNGRDGQDGDAREARKIYTPEDLAAALALLADRPDDVALNRTVWGYYTEKGRYQALVEHAGPVFRRSYGMPGRERLALTSGAFISQAWVFQENFDSVEFYLSRVMPLTESADRRNKNLNKDRNRDNDNRDQSDNTNQNRRDKNLNKDKDRRDKNRDNADRDRSDDLMVALTHNIAALFYLKTQLDYSSALEHYEAAFEIMERMGDITNQSTLLCNMASIYVSLRDPAGFDYARRAYDISHSDPEARSYGRVFSTILLGQMYRLKEDPGSAIVYADEAAGEVGAFPQFVSSLDLLYADIAADRGDHRGAERHYRKALEGEGDTEPGVNALICLRYGELLSGRGRWSEARGVLEKGLAMRGVEYRDELLLALSNVAVRQGLDDDALEFYKEYHARMDSASSVQRERAFRQNRILAKDNELQSRELDLLRANRRILVFVSASALILIIAVALWMINRRQNRMYRRIVEVHQQLLARVGDAQTPYHYNPAAQQDPSHDPDRPQENPKDDNPAAQQDREREDRDLALWRRLDRMMASESIYRHSDISLDRIAEMLGTNRAYVSRVINHYSGTSFYNYIHSRRIEEASRRLSDPSADVSLKTLAAELGYNSISSFYRAFTREIGVPPSRYREVILQIK
jgi:AraC-like DNA-binding protein/Tfp pilus assembly protein PilF